MTDKHELLMKILRTFIISILFAIMGMFIGTFIPPSWMLPLIILQLVLIIAAFFFRKNKKIGYGFLFFFTTLTGITAYPVVSHYAGVLGAEAVILALVTTVLIFTVLGVYSWVTKRDFSSMGGFLFVALMALIVLSIINIFFPFGSTMMFIITLGGILIFSGFVLYDISVIKNQPLTEEDVPIMALGLYLDFLNLFLYILRFIGLLNDD